MPQVNPHFKSERDCIKYSEVTHTSEVVKD